MKQVSWPSLSLVGGCFLVLCALGTPPLVLGAQAEKSRSLSAKKELKREGRFEQKRDYGLDEEVKSVKGLKSKSSPSDDKPELAWLPESRSSLEGLVEAKLDEEIELAQRLLELEKPCGEGPRVRFRLADLYWEKSKREFFRSNDFTLRQEARATALVAMKEFQGKTVDSYLFIVDECVGYPQLARVHYELGKTLVEMGRAEEGATHFKAIIDSFSNSAWIANAWFMIGEYFFNTESRPEQALKAYRRVREFEESSVSSYAIFKEGWCYINMGSWDLALSRFKEVLKTTKESTVLGVSERRALRKASLKDFVRAYVHLDSRYSRGGIGGSKGAYALFRKFGGRAEALWMLELLGEWYVNWDAHHDVKVVYQELVLNFPQSSRLGVFRARLVFAQDQLGNYKSATKEVRRLGSTLRRLSQKYQGSEPTSSVKDGLERDYRQSIEISEKTIRQLALDAHAVAKKLRGKAQRRKYKYVRNLYGEYLSIFSSLKGTLSAELEFFMRFYFAEVLFEQGDFLAAARSYDAVVQLNSNPKTERERTLLEAAAEEAVRSYEEYIASSERKKNRRARGIEPRPIPQVKKELVAACGRYIELVGGKGDKIVPIRYKVARVYYTYNHFDKAAPAFDDIVKNHPRSDVACYAANLTLDIYNGLGDFVALKQIAFEYVRNSKLACDEKQRSSIREIGENAAFKVIEVELAKTKNFSEAASAFVAYQQEYPDGNLADDAIFNAALNFELGGKEGMAHKMRELLVENYPRSDLVPDTLFSMGTSADRSLDFNQAALRFELFANRYPEDQRARDALFNAGVYWKALGDVNRSLRKRRELLKRFPKDPMAATLAFGICEELESAVQVRHQKLGPNRSLDVDRSIRKAWKVAHQCFYDFIRNATYVSQRPELLCLAQYRRGEIMRIGLKDVPGEAEIGRYLDQKWTRWKSKSKTMPRCLEVMSGKKFRETEIEFFQFEQMQLGKVDPSSELTIRRFQQSLKAKIQRRDQLILRYKDIIDMGNGTWALAAVVRIGDAHLEVMDDILNAELPEEADLGAEEKALIRQELERQAEPVAKEAVIAYELSLRFASQWSNYNQWSKRARLNLERLRPNKYPRSRGVSGLALSEAVIQTPKSVERVFEFVLQPRGDSTEWEVLPLQFRVAPKSFLKRELPVEDTLKKDLPDEP